MDLISNIYRSDSDDSSDDEFEFELNFRPRSVLTDFDEETPKPPSRVFDSEYYKLPPIEKLCLDDKNVDQKKLEPMGSILNIIDFVVTIKPNEQIPSLDYDTVLFDENAEVMGTIFEIFGLVNEPMYAIRFNNAEEAQKWPVGTKVMYDPKNFELTHTTIIESLTSKQMKNCDDGGEDPAFSDDEAERQYVNKQRAKNRAPSQMPMTQVPPQKRERFFFR
ncbi:H/ACA ribonucleoprotein complex non-core subunit NAF1 [Aphelenchoides bicaudatus]|nr:H/ACA ribonucleoprotein complex non-core subunit NAF1 [Aphelenchoides bicaudatus]